MKQFVTRRLGYSLISLLVLSLTIFFFVRITGDPASLLVEMAPGKLTVPDSLRAEIDDINSHAEG